MQLHPTASSKVLLRMKYRCSGDFRMVRDGFEFLEEDGVIIFVNSIRHPPPKMCVLLYCWQNGAGLLVRGGVEFLEEDGEIIFGNFFRHPPPKH